MVLAVTLNRPSSLASDVRMAPHRIPRSRIRAQPNLPIRSYPEPGQQGFYLVRIDAPNFPELVGGHKATQGLTVPHDATRQGPPDARQRFQRRAVHPIQIQHALWFFGCLESGSIFPVQLSRLCRPRGNVIEKHQQRIHPPRIARRFLHPQGRREPLRMPAPA